MAATLLSVQVGAARPLRVPDAEGGREVLSGIRKLPVSTAAQPARVAVGRLGLAGDEQADPSVHGGLDKAVYAYPAEHYAFWQTFTEVAEALPPGRVGENLTLSGLLEADLWIGDRLHIGTCVFVVESPRRPCYKFNTVMGAPGAARAMLEHGLTGWYLSVDQAGDIGAGDAVSVEPGPRRVRLTERQQQMIRPVDRRD